MTTLKPQLIRADTLDLQDQDAPSAKDHTRQPAHPAPYGVGPAAPHQNQALRNAEHEAHEEQKYSPITSPRQSDERLRSLYSDEPDFYDDHEDGDQHEHSAPHGHLVGELDHSLGMEDGDGGDQGDDDSEDDMMDKISSSPSIDDGKYALPVMWPPRWDSMVSGAPHSPFSTPTRGGPCSSLPCTSTPSHFPLSLIEEAEDNPESHHGGYPGCKKSRVVDPRTRCERVTERSPYQVSHLDSGPDNPTEFDDYASDLDVQDVGRYLLPADDPLLDNSVDDVDENPFYENHADSEWEDEDDNATLKSESSSDDDTGGFLFTTDTRFIDSGWGGECLREIEDIDFEFVYALHTFVATVEGQANATKGDTMVLLDDSNSYWWLVRVVKDGSIGYLPAEHIETPTERLARLNKHRNIDLSATMLGDNPEKPKNPLKKAMRRRNAKTVQFAAPQYFEPSDFDYSDEEEEGQERQPEPGDSGLQGAAQDPPQESGDEVATVAPLKISTQQAPGPVTNGIHRIRSDESMDMDKASSPDKQALEEEAPTNEVQDETNTRPRNRAVRNTDSFYKDETVETKKISLTPRLLRGDLDASAPSEQAEARPQPNVDTFDKIVSADNDKVKDDKKKKEKKGMLSGLFKRKDKKAKPGESEVDDAEKTSEESTRMSTPSRESHESLSGRLATSPQRQTSKLQKQPPAKISTKSSPVQDGFQPREPLSTTTSEPKSSPTSQTQVQPDAVRTGGPEQPNGEGSYGDQSAAERNAQVRSTSPTTSPVDKKSFFSPITTALRPSSSNASPEDEPVVKAVYAKKAKHRFEIDAADSEDEGAPIRATKPHLSISPVESRPPMEQPPGPRQEPLAQVLFMEEPKQAPPPPPSQTRPLPFDTPASEPQSTSPASPSPSSSPSLVDLDTVNDVDQSTNDTTTSPRAEAYTPSTMRSTPTWSDASLRNYMDNDQGIRDLLIIVHDKSNVVPAGPDHPMTGTLFATEKGRLAEMQTTLDSMLTSWLARKNSTLLSR